MLLAILAFPDKDKYDVSSMDNITSAGAVATPDLLERAKEHFGLLVCRSSYGMTEMVARIYCINNKSYGPSSPIPHTTLKIVDDQGNIVKRGIPGEIHAYSPYMMKGYLGIPKEQTFTKDGFFPTGDVGVIDEKGELAVTGRIKDLIIRGGSNIWPAEIENILNKHPSVQEGAIVGHPDRVLGETVIAYVVPRKGTVPPTEHELKEYLEARVMRIAIPKYIFFIDDFPRNSFGKVFKQELKSKTDDFIRKRWEDINIPEDKKPKSEIGKAIAKL